jgi:hypothetical protein
VRHGRPTYEWTVVGVDSWAREANVTGASLLILLPWLVFAAGLVALGVRLLVIRRGRRHR